MDLGRSVRQDHHSSIFLVIREENKTKQNKTKKNLIVLSSQTRNVIELCQTVSQRLNCCSNRSLLLINAKTGILSCCSEAVIIYLFFG